MREPDCFELTRHGPCLAQERVTSENSPSKVAASETPLANFKTRGLSVDFVHLAVPAPLTSRRSKFQHASGAFCDFALCGWCRLALTNPGGVILSPAGAIGHVGARSQHLAAARRASSPKAVAISGPILSIVPPCFGQTGMECWAERRRPSVNPPAALMRVTLD